MDTTTNKSPDFPQRNQFAPALPTLAHARIAARNEEAKAIARAEALAISPEPALSRGEVGLGEGKGLWLSPFADAAAINDDGVRDLLPLFDLETNDPIFDGDWPTQKEVWRAAREAGKERNPLRRPLGPPRTISPAASLPVYSPLLRDAPDEQPRLRNLRGGNRRKVKVRKTIAGRARPAREARISLGFTRQQSPSRKASEMLDRWREISAGQLPQVE